MKERHITRMSLDEALEIEGQTDWKRLQGETEDPPVDEDEFEVDWSTAKLVPGLKTMVSLRLDPDILAFFKSEGKGYQTRINAVLRTYVEARKRQAP